MEHQVKQRLKEMFVPDLAIFEVEFERVRPDIMALQRLQTLTFLVPAEAESEEEEEEEVLYNITGKPVDLKDKGERKRSKGEDKNILVKKKKKERE